MTSPSLSSHSRTQDDPIINPETTDGNPPQYPSIIPPNTGKQKRSIAWNGENRRSSSSGDHDGGFGDCDSLNDDDNFDAKKLKSMTGKLET
uniref:Uncharacterized protein n=1 Tax=Loa loa TaxID=7209 RepID=A0A1I7VWS8_LOALO